MTAPRVTYDAAAGVLLVETFRDDAQRLPLADALAARNKPEGCACSRLARMGEGDDMGSHAAGRFRYRHRSQCPLNPDLIAFLANAERAGS